MDKITVKNYRCFRDEQSARLAPLTLLVGDNSTGKTSFMAMIRILEDLAFGNDPLDFKREPYDLGSFDDIIHHQNNRGTSVRQTDSFEAGFCATGVRNFKNQPKETKDYQFKAIFGEEDTSPMATKLHLDLGNCWIKVFLSGNSPSIQVGNKKGSWKRQFSRRTFLSDMDTPQSLPRLASLVTLPLRRFEQHGDQDLKPVAGSPEISQEDADLIYRELTQFPRILRRRGLQRSPYRVFASAPVRSKPRRTYDPARPIPDSEGDYVPMYLANMFFRKEDTWEHLKNKLQEFGRAAGLFDEISIKQLGKRHSEPFQVQIRKFGGPKKKGPSRNLIDVGYGVSQILPVITELLREDAPVLFLLQQPEVHLHPSAQAALGSLFCQVASSRRQLVVETHSDYLLDRIRIDIREGRTHLKPDDVSILFFERNNLDVTIHSLRIDKEGNVLEAPPSYRNFFMEETANLLRL